MNKIYLVNNYIDIPDTINNGGDEKSIVFVGKMDYEPNILAVEFFVNNVFNKLSKHFPDYKFIIIGSRPSPRVKRLGSEKIIITGFVESIDSYLKNTTLFVAPMLTGSGIQNKILQAMAYGCCVVTTPIGREGLGINENGLIICSSNKEWLTQMTFMLKNKKERIRNGLIARQFVKNHFSKEIVRKQFQKFISL